MVTSLREPMSVKFKMWNELAHAVFCAQLGLACVLCNEVCSVTGADVFKIEHIRETLETTTPGHTGYDGPLMSGSDVLCVLLSHELAQRREVGKKVT